MAGKDTLLEKFRLFATYNKQPEILFMTMSDFEFFPIPIYEVSSLLCPFSHNHNNKITTILHSK